MLLILAGISIATLTGENGVLSKASKAKLKDDNAKVYETLKLEEQDHLVETTTNMTQKDLITRLQEDKIIDSNYIINVQALLGTKLSTGNGTGTKDVYKLEEITELGKMASIETVKLASNSNTKTYMVVYYNEKGERTELGTIGESIAGTQTGYYDGLDVTPTNADYFEFIYNEDTKTAILAKVKDEHSVLSYYEGEKLVQAIVDGDTEITDVVIPAVISKDNIEYKVTEIGEDVFMDYYRHGKNRFTSFTIPDTVTKIGRRAFHCNNATFNLSKNLTDIGEEAFFGCKKLTNIDKLTKLTTMGRRAFWATGLTHVTLPEGVTVLESDVFRDCASLESIILPNSLTTIKSWVFNECNALKKLIIPAGVREIDPNMWTKSGIESLTVADGNSIFDSRENCNAIIETETNTMIRACKNTVIPSTVTKLGKYCFYWVEDLETINVPDGVNTIGDNAFDSCKARSISLPESVIEIGEAAFCRCSNLESVNIPRGVTAIKSETFYACSKLTNLTIPNSVKTIEKSETWPNIPAFKNCTNLTITIQAGSSLVIPENKWGAKEVIKES